MNQGKDKFIILKKIRYAEADLIIHALSPQGEKLSFIARGALKSKKRFGGGVLEPTHFVMLTYKKSMDEGQLNTLQEAQLLSDFPGLRSDYDRLELGLHLLECVSKVSQEGDTSSDFLFNLLGNALRALEQSQDILVTKMHFYLKFLFQQGVIQAEPWMGPFLKLSLSQGAEISAYRESVDEELYNVEQMVKHYLQHAMV